MLWLVQRLSVAYFARDAVLLEPAAASDSLFIIKQGTVSGDTADGQTVLQLATGEMFPLGALLADRGAANRYVAATDTFCYLLAAADFHTLLATSTEFNDFCTRRIANLLEESQHPVQYGIPALALDTTTAGHARWRPRSAARRYAYCRKPWCPTCCRRWRAAIGSMIVVEAGGQPVGLTLRDVLASVTLAGLTLATPVGSDERAPGEHVATPRRWTSALVSWRTTASTTCRW